jgi:membrane protein
MTSIPVATRPLFSRVFRLFLRVARAMGVHNAFAASAAVAFWFFLSLVPLLVLAGFLVGQVARTRGMNALVGPLLDVIPSAAEGIVREEVGRLARASASSLAPLGVAGFLWTASSGLHNLMDVLETAAQGKRRPWWKKRGIALVGVIVGLGVTCALASFLVKVDSALRARAGQAVEHVAGTPRHGGHQGIHSPLGHVIAATLLLIVGTALLGALYRLAMAHPSRGRQRVWPGTITAVVCWLVVSWAFGAYVVSVSEYALYYGSLAAVAVLLVWLYLTSLSLVVGAEVNADIGRWRSGSRAERSHRPSHKPEGGVRR